MCILWLQQMFLTMKYLYIFDYTRGICEIFTIYGDPMKWMENNGYNLDDIAYMITEEFRLIVDV